MGAGQGMGAASADMQHVAQLQVVGAFLKLS